MRAHLRVRQLFHVKHYLKPTVPRRAPFKSHPPRTLPIPHAPKSTRSALSQRILTLPRASFSRAKTTIPPRKTVSNVPNVHTHPKQKRSSGIELLFCAYFIKFSLNQSGVFLICAYFLGNLLGVDDNLFTTIIVLFSFISSPLTQPTRATS